MWPLSKPAKGSAGKTGLWRYQRPVVDRGKCVQCGVCFTICPDSAITFSEDFPVFDYEYCKGCGLCAAECPVKAISMSEEAEGECLGL